MVGAHISSLLSFKFFVTVQSPISIFLPFRMALNRYNFSFSCSRFNRWTYYTKKMGVFLSFSGSLYIKKEMSFHISFLSRTFFVIDIVFLLFLSAPVLIWCTSDQLPERFTEIRKISIADFHRNFADRKWGTAEILLGPLNGPLGNIIRKRHSRCFHKNFGNVVLWEEHFSCKHGSWKILVQILFDIVF